MFIDEALDGTLIEGKATCLFGRNDCAEFVGNMGTGIILGSGTPNATKCKHRHELYHLSVTALLILAIDSLLKLTPRSPPPSRLGLGI